MQIHCKVEEMWLKDHIRAGKYMLKPSDTRATVCNEWKFVIKKNFTQIVAKMCNMHKHY